MSDSNVIDCLRVSFARVHERFDAQAQDILDLKVRLAGVETGMGHIMGQLGHLQVQIAGLTSRADRTDARLERIERRLDLMPAA